MWGALQSYSRPKQVEKLYLLLFKLRKTSKSMRFKYLRRCCGIIWRYRCSHKNIFHWNKQMGLNKRMAMKEYFFVIFSLDKCVGEFSLNFFHHLCAKFTHKVTFNWFKIVLHWTEEFSLEQTIYCDSRTCVCRKSSHHVSNLSHMIQYSLLQISLRSSQYSRQPQIC